MTILDFSIPEIVEEGREAYRKDSDSKVKIPISDFPYWTDLDTDEDAVTKHVSFWDGYMDEFKKCMKQKMNSPKG